MARAWPALFGMALKLWAQDGAAAQNGALDSTPTLLERVRAHMVETLAQQPNYTCLETIKRANRAGKEKEYRLLDTVRLEVALVDGREMFAWPGSKQFEDTDLRTFVPTGMFGNGDFGLYSKAVFGGRLTQFEDKGEAKLGERSTRRFDFRVPLALGMRIRQPDMTVTVGYHGSFYAETGTLDALRLEVEADDLPLKLDLRQVSDTMEYKRTRIGSRDFLLPSVSEVVMVDLRGDASRNVVRFSECHEFAGESTLKFGDEDDAAAASAPAAVAKQEVKLPKNSEITLRLAGEIDTDKAAVGDPVKAALASDVKEKGKVILQKGVEVSGRIVRLEHYQDFTVLGLMFEEAESETVHVKLDLTMDRAAGSDVLSSQRWGASSPPRPHEGLVPLRPGHLRLSRGVVMFWRN